MNCKQGDIAIVIRCRNNPKWLGRVVECKELLIHPIFDIPGWAVSEGLHDGDIVIADECLRPLRDNPGQDETLSWKDVPKGVTA